MNAAMTDRPQPAELWKRCTTYVQFIFLMIKHGWLNPQQGPVPTDTLLAMQDADEKKRP